MTAFSSPISPIDPWMIRTARSSMIWSMLTCTGWWSIRARVGWPSRRASLFPGASIRTVIWLRDSLSMFGKIVPHSARSPARSGSAWQSSETCRRSSAPVSSGQSCW